MTPIDKATQGQKEAAMEEADLREDWEKEDIKDANRKPTLEESDKDPSATE